MNKARMAGSRNATTVFSPLQQRFVNQRSHQAVFKQVSALLWRRNANSEPGRQKNNQDAHGYRNLGASGSSSNEEYCDHHQRHKRTDEHRTRELVALAEHRGDRGRMRQGGINGTQDDDKR